ncbi:unknown [Crocosphaera subtropica ATCC 51142]|uniref:DUF6473 domain-containing protein n=1 Tax=Crocosphaera subtropica (strain ATCC 51142 / BH68) TaxID=43989 RepID=B1WVB1_CROS5|nr:DUF6473 family protein [Crocosphaera subtropica]ACB53901.1 unknown [Crocosphaera subtropica ATCC 51142]
MSEIYQERDWEVIDYQIYHFQEADVFFRGPQPEFLKPYNYAICIGAAQTFGCYCEKPFPYLLQEKLNIPILNWGRGGAGPYFFLKRAKLLDYINEAKFVIIQVMSGRSQGNSLYQSEGIGSYTRASDGIRISCKKAYQELLERYDETYVKKIVAETRVNWVKTYQEFLSKITIPKILFWFSSRYSNYEERYKNTSSLFGKYPQLINQKMVEQIKQFSDDYIECIYPTNSPKLLINRFTGKPANIEDEKGKKTITHDYYYPTPESHIMAANVLEKVCWKYLN